MVQMKCEYGAGKYTVECMDFRKSPYFGLFPTVRDFDFLPYYSTVDDPVIIDVANQLNRQLEGRADRTKVAVVLSLVQQNIKYVSDESRFGKDVWELPIYTISEKVADCDGMSNLFTSIAHNMGLDVATVCVTGHMCSAVNFEGAHGVSYKLDGENYYHVETTADLPATGRYWSSSRFLGMAKPAVPTAEFLKTLSKTP